jgi:oligopeptidase B
VAATIVPVGVSAKSPARGRTATPPVAEKRPYTIESANGARVDPYYWIRDDTRSKKDVLDYLKAENAYFEDMSAPYKPLQTKLTRELIGRVKQNDDTVPYKYKDFLYSMRFVAGKEYPIYVRQPVGSSAQQLLVDANAEAKGHLYYHVGDYDVSASQSILAFTEDTGGRRQYTLRFRD